MLFEEWLASIRPEWMRDALCHEYPLRLFFPSRGEATDTVKLSATGLDGLVALRAHCTVEGVSVILRPHESAIAQICPDGGRA